MPARINKIKAAEILHRIRADVDRQQLIIKTQPQDPERAAQRQKLLEGFPDAINKKLDELDQVLNINTKIPKD